MKNHYNWFEYETNSNGGVKIVRSFALTPFFDASGALVSIGIGIAYTSPKENAVRKIGRSIAIERSEKFKSMYNSCASGVLRSEVNLKHDDQYIVDSILLCGVDTIVRAMLGDCNIFFYPDENIEFPRSVIHAILLELNHPDAMEYSKDYAKKGTANPTCDCNECSCDSKGNV